MGVENFYNPQDDCVYFFNEQKEIYQKLCNVGKFVNLPFNVKLQIKAAKEEAKKLINLPTE